MNIFRKIVKFIFGTFGEPAKEDIKAKLDRDSLRTESKFVKNRNEIEKLLIDMVDDHAVDEILDLVDKKVAKRK